MEQTLSIIKPDAVAAGLANAINDIIVANDLFIIAQARLQLTQKQAEEFYAEHTERPFFGSLIKFMTSGQAVFQILEGEDAIKKYRKLMGDTDPNKAAEHTIRHMFGQDIEHNAVHGSDSKESSIREIAFFKKLILQNTKTTKTGETR